MFTGIIESIAEVLKNQDRTIVVHRPKEFDDIRLGSSIAVSGVCLTVSALTLESLTFDVTEETQRVTTLGNHIPGMKVNMERAMSAQGRFEGHIVQGHVEGRGSVLEPAPELRISFPQTLRPFLVLKGSLTIDGVSLTIASLDNDSCSFALVPFTLNHTTLGSLQKGTEVNIETDVIGKYASNFYKFNPN